GASTGRVTVAKEVVRLLGELGSEEAYRELLALAARDLQRDVRLALMRALWGFADRVEAWAIMEWAARSGDAALAAAVVAIPAARLSVDGQRRFVALVADLLRHPEPSVRLQVLGRCGREPLPDPERR